MENASKALLIAGAILIAILLIALGMMAYTAGKAQVEKSGTQLDDAQIQANNAQFVNYQGMRSGSEVRALVNLVKSVNANSNSPFASLNSKKGIYIQGSDATSYNMSNISVNKNYRITCEFNSSGNGLVTNINITETTNKN